VRESTLTIDLLGYEELLRIIRKNEDDYDIEALLDVRFVPLIGEEGWKA
jgi:hypothetical protein